MPTASSSSAETPRRSARIARTSRSVSSHQVPVAQPVDDLAHHELVGPPARPVRLHGGDRDPDLLVDLEPVARELRADAREQPDHLEGLARDADPAAERLPRAEQAPAHLVAEHDDAAAVLDVVARDAAPGGERHAAHRHRLRVDAAHVDAGSRAGRRRPAGSPTTPAPTSSEQLRALAQQLDVVQREPEVAAVDGGREVLARRGRPRPRPCSCRRLKKPRSSMAVHAHAPADQEDHRRGAPDRARRA